MPDDDYDTTSQTGDLEKVELCEGYEEFDFEIPFIIRDAEEEMRERSIDPLQLPVFSHPNLQWLKGQIGKGDQFSAKHIPTGTQFGDFRVDGGVMTATGYNDYLSRMTRRVAEALGGGITKSQTKYNEISQFPFFQNKLPLLTGWLDAYIRGRLFGETFDPLFEDELCENWRVLLLDDVAQHIASRFASALTANEENIAVSEAEVSYRKLSEVESINVRASSCVEVRKCIYLKLRLPAQRGGLEKTFMEWADSDGGVLAFCKIDENKHTFLRRPYLKADGFPSSYSPDFLVKTEGHIYVVETKAQNDLVNENVQRKKRSTLTWCEQINALLPEQRGGCEWNYVLLGEKIVTEYRSKNGRVEELLNFARLREVGEAQGRLRLS